MHEKLIHRYCRAVGSYLPCSLRQKREILLGLRQRLEDHCAEHPESAEDLEAVFGTPQAVAAAYIDDMDTGGAAGGAAPPAACAAAGGRGSAGGPGHLADRVYHQRHRPS